MFQRPYVWNQEDQWDPLWDDVEAVADRLLTSGENDLTPLFLGAIVVAQQHTATGDLDLRHIVDGQQRLTTVQLLLDAVEEVIRLHGDDRDSKRLRKLVINDQDLFEGDRLFKVWPTNVDQDAFRMAMDDDAVVPDDYMDRRIAQAHDVFKKKARHWADVHGDTEKCVEKLTALTTVLIRYLQVVVIDLTPDDDDQMIFETLNARGTPLLASDLVKNYLIREAVEQNLDSKSLYQDHWLDFDTERWRKEVRLGRIYWPRVDAFLYSWMVMELAREVSTQRMFSEFLALARGSGGGPAEIMADLARFGKIYDHLDSFLEDSSSSGRFFYRWRTMQVSVLTPLLMWIYSNEDVLGDEQMTLSLEMLESWMVRRMVCRSSTRGHGQFLYSLLKELKAAPSEAFASVLSDRLLQESADTAGWPTDAQFKTAIVENPLYRQLTRSRLRIVLEAIEDHLREVSGKTEESCPKNLTVEHVMPQQWDPAWLLPEDSGDGAKERRETLLHTLGNLTLVNEKLNPALSNSKWSKKKPALVKHSVLHLKDDIVEAVDWDEDSIFKRSERLAEIVCEIWPRPEDSS